uniref:Knottins-like domain-containing protein n=1 Tax=Leersia perrieri TaxID=77586 RepID=A0A0D9VCR3_9ORYZ
MKNKVAVTALVLLLLTFGCEAKICQEHSRTFKGLCWNNNNCVSSCVAEQFTGGFCSGIVDRKCICTKQCDDQPPMDLAQPPPKKKRPPTRAATTVLVLLLLILGGEAGKMCHDPSQTFKGMCFHTMNCISSCTNEGYTGGYCTYLKHKCICTKPCVGEGPPDEPPDKICQQHSGTFKGICFNNNNCVSYCVAEQFTSGFCSGVVDRGEAVKMCHDPSQNFKGMCFQNLNCISSCTNEGYTGGHCTYITHKCICTKPCGGEGGEAGKMCHDPSQTFKGMCFRNMNCISCCTNEGYTGGYCSYLKHKCICTKPCGGEGPPDEPPATASRA